MVEHQPPKGFIDVQQEVAHLFEDLVRQPWSGHESTAAGDWQPRCDLAETDEAVIVEVELPGVSCDQIRVTVEGDCLYVAGECQSTVEHRGRQIYMRERHSGRFARKLPLPCRVIATDVQLAYSEGILIVTLPKQPQQATLG